MRNGCVCAIELCDWWPVVSLMVGGDLCWRKFFYGDGFCFGLLVDFVK